MHKRLLRPGLFVVGFAIIATILIFLVSAATLQQVVEPEDGVMSGNASLQTEDGVTSVLFQAPQQPQTQLIWQDTFDTSLDLTTDTHAGAWRPNDFWQSINRGYRDFAGTNWNLNPNETPGYNPFSVSGGVLRITSQRTPTALNATIAASMAAQQQSGAVPAWSGGMLITNKNLRTFGYGYYEFRTRFPTPGKGMFPALWLYSADGTFNPGKEGAEIDILEIFGHANGAIVDTTIQYPDGSSSFNGQISGDTTGWHTYALDWQQNYMRFYKDDVLYAEADAAHAAWYNGVKMGIRINYAMDAPWFGARASDASTPSPLAMEVDYVKVYDRKP